MRTILSLLLLLLLYTHGITQNCTVNSETLTIRSKVDNEGTVLKVFRKGQVLFVTDMNGQSRWAMVAVNGANGYVLKQYITCKQESAKKEKQVWICMGKSAYAYHSNNSCSGLNRCKATISQVSEQEAKNTYYRRPCQKCY